MAVDENCSRLLTRHGRCLKAASFDAQEACKTRKPSRTRTAADGSGLRRFLPSAHALLRWPLFFCACLVISVVLHLYFAIRALIHASEWLFAPSATRRARRAMLRAHRPEEYTAAAQALDQANGLEEWKSRPQSRYYACEVLASVLVEIVEAREHAKWPKLMRVLQKCLQDVNYAGHLNELLYAKSFTGTKHLIEDYCEAVAGGLEDLRQEVRKANDTDDKDFLAAAQRFTELSVCTLGRTALCLSGGGAMAFQHFGVVEELLRRDLLPKIISGTSGGAAIAAYVCCRTDEELLGQVERDQSPFRNYPLALDPDEIQPSITLWAGSWYERLRHYFRHGCVFPREPIERWAETWALGDTTFLEAFRRSGRVLNITCSIVAVDSSEQVPLLLNYQTHPHVLIASAVICSGSMPGLLNPSKLLEKCPDSGIVRPHCERQTCYADGSIDFDIPSLSLSQAFGVRYTVAVQVNPHAPGAEEEELWYHPRDRGAPRPRLRMEPAAPGVMDVEPEPEEAEELARDLDEHLVWRKNAPLLYDLYMECILTWPAQSIAWLADEESSLTKLALGSRTDGSEPCRVMVLELSCQVAEAESDPWRSWELPLGHAHGFGLKGIREAPPIGVVSEMVVDSEVNRLAACPTSSHLLAVKGSCGTVWLFDHREPAAPKTAFRTGEDVEGYALAWSSKGLIATGNNDGRLILWSAATPAHPTWQMPKTHGSGALNDLGFAASGAQCATVGEDNQVAVWDLRAKSKALSLAASAEQLTVDWNPWEQLLATGGKDNLVHIWDLRACQAPLKSLAEHRAEIQQLRWCPMAEERTSGIATKDLLGSCSADGKAVVWNLGGTEPDDGQAPEVLFVHSGHRDAVTDFGWSFLDDFLFCSVGDDNALQLWQPAAAAVEPENDGPNDGSDAGAVTPFNFALHGEAGRPISWSSPSGRGSWRGGFILCALEVVLKESFRSAWKVMGLLQLLPRYFGCKWDLFFAQVYEGSVTLSTENGYFWKCLNALENPCPEAFRYWWREGQVMAWQKIPLLEKRLRTEHALFRLEHEVVAEPPDPPCQVGRALSLRRRSSLSSTRLET
ncbi:unnamed protein product [Effrenium voratum]|nr:unnamed protein product [Effrenium voratum]